MQKTFKAFTVLTFAAFGAFFFFSTGASARFLNKTNSAPLSAAASSAAPNLYASNCARCHGSDGKGDTEVGRRMDVPDLSVSGRRMSAAKISGIIAKGKGEMPAFGKKLNKKQIAAIAAYVRKL